jgi:hypothetical protein
MLFQLFALAVGAGLAASTAGNAPMLLAASLLVAAASLIDALAPGGAGCCALWPYVEAWLSLAALQTGFVAGAYARDVFGAAPVNVSRLLTRRGRDRSA